MNPVRIALVGASLFWGTANGVCLLAEDAPADIDAVFQRLDKNGDGKVSASEIPEEQTRFFERLLRKANKEANGELTREEFRQANRPDERPGVRIGNPGGGPDQGPGGDPKQRFEMLDRNKDGKLTLSEVPEPLRDRLKPLFDRSGKQELTLEDFTRLTAPGSRPDPAEIFKRFDANADGKLSKDEMPAEMRDRMAPVFERLGKTELTLDDLAGVFAARASRGDGNPPSGGERRPEGTRADSERKPDASPEGMRPGERRTGDIPPEGRGPLVFRLLDTNHDGHISKEEAARFGELFEQLDRNHDGQLDLPELMGPPPGSSGRRPGTPEGSARDEATRREPSREGAAGRERPTGAGDGERGAFFKRLDRDGDGKISKDEAPGFLKDKFGMLDTNGDEFISQDEMRAGAQILGELFRSRQSERAAASRPE